MIFLYITYMQSEVMYVNHIAETRNTYSQNSV